MAINKFKYSLKIISISWLAKTISFASNETIVKQYADKNCNNIIIQNSSNKLFRLLRQNKCGDGKDKRAVSLISGTIHK